MNLTLWIALTVVVVASIPALLLAAECLLALIPAPIDSAGAAAARPSIAVLMPAHNEESVIGESITAILPQLMPGDRLLVVADNCTDRTAEVAVEAGAQVTERHDADRRGKGFALAHGVAALASSPPDILVIVDADCHCSPGSLAVLAKRAFDTQRPAQALYLLEPAAVSGPRGCVSAFAFLVKNQVRALGAARLGIPCLLRGTGMAIPWEVIHDAPLATGNIVEDLQLGIDLAFGGNAPVFCPQACVHGTLPSDGRAALNQRRRWEHGHLHTIMSTVIPTLWRAIKSGRPALALLALDVAVPPLSLLVLSWGALGVCMIALAKVTGILPPLVSWVGVTALLVLALAASWMRFGRRVVSAGTLAAIPLYVLAKIPLYLSYFFSPQRDWVRTERTPAADSTSHVP